MATMLCKEMNVAEIVVKGIDERHAEMARRLGATQIIFSERDTARRVALNLVTTHAVDCISVDADINILSLTVPRQFVGKNLIEANLRADFGVNIVAVVNREESLIPPPPKRPFAADDKIFVIGTVTALEKFERGIR